jgi:hypothetical protein
MLETIEATIDTLGNVVLSEKVRLGKKHRALVTILEEAPVEKSSFKLVGSLEVVGDLDEGSLEISEMFRNSIERTDKELGL